MSATDLPDSTPDSELVSIKVLNSSNGFCCSSDIVAALDWVLTNRPDVGAINMSLGTNARFATTCDTAASWTISLASAIDALRANGTLSFVSSGNDADGTSLQAPACIASAIAVGAVYDGNVGSPTFTSCSDPTTTGDQVTCYTNSNAVLDVMAPGASVTSAGVGGGTSTYWGTSQASPHAAGCAADLLQAYPTATPDMIEAALEGTGVSVTDSKNGLSFPRIDCLGALQSMMIFFDGFESGNTSSWSSTSP